MNIITSTDNLPENSFVATIGFFDGVHLGHRHLLNLLINEAKTLKKKSLVISFDKHPKTILPTDYIPDLLTNNEEKVKLLEDIGIDACAILPFDKEMANLTAYDFLQKIIVGKLKVHTLYVGYDHRFGKNREEGLNEYIKYGKMLELNIVEASSFSMDETQISSSIIRRALKNGDIEKANQLLSYSYSLTGVVVEGSKLGRSIGFPTANIELNTNKVVPAYGVYIVQAFVQNAAYWGMLNIGKRPTIKENDKETIEVHIIDLEKDIYDEKITVSLLQKIRDEIKFNSTEELKAAIKNDKQITLDFSQKYLQK